MELEEIRRRTVGKIDRIGPKIDQQTSDENRYNRAQQSGCAIEPENKTGIDKQEKPNEEHLTGHDPADSTTEKEQKEGGPLSQGEKVESNQRKEQLNKVQINGCAGLHKQWVNH